MPILLFFFFGGSSLKESTLLSVGGIWLFKSGLTFDSEPGPKCHVRI
jgi:hypothetical protein